MTERFDVVQAAKRMLRARRRRERFIPLEVLGEPGWDILLYLLVSQAEGREVPLKSACHASGAPTSTAMRCLQRLRGHQLVAFDADPVDRRRTLLTLTEFGQASVRAALLSTCEASLEEGLAIGCEDPVMTDQGSAKYVV